MSGLRVPTHVTLTHTSSSTFANLKVINGQVSQSLNHNLTVCIHAAYFGNVPTPSQLIEFIEMYRLLGADKFVSYNAARRTGLDHIEKYYRGQDLLDIYNWDLPTNIDAFYYAQHSLVQDCIYRYMYSSKFIALVNVDEFILPRIHSNLLGMLNNLSCRNVGQYLFQNKFFPLNLPNTNEVIRHKNNRILQSTLLNHVMKEDKDWGYNHHSKTVVNPRSVEIGEIHNMRKMRHGATTCRVSPQKAVMQHYREWNVRDDVPIVVDVTARRFLYQLEMRLSKAYHKIYIK